MYYPIPKSVNVKKRPYPTKRSTGDIDNIKILFDSLMLATKESWKNKKEKPLFDDSQVVDLVVQQRYWSESDYGLDVSYKILEEGEDTWEKMNK
jgi:Holliday junction resolvase RusA-like endonuclease